MFRQEAVQYAVQSCLLSYRRSQPDPGSPFREGAKSPGGQSKLPSGSPEKAPSFQLAFRTGHYSSNVIGSSQAAFRKQVDPRCFAALLHTINRDFGGRARARRLKFKAFAHPTRAFPSCGWGCFAWNYLEDVPLYPSP